MSTTTATRSFDIDQITRGAAVAVIWTSTIDGQGDFEGEPVPMDERYSVDDITPETLADLRKIVAHFIDAHAADLTACGLEDSYIGHNFALEVVGAGLGFRDREIDSAVALRLSTATEAYNLDASEGDDKRIHLSAELA